MKKNITKWEAKAILLALDSFRHHNSNLHKLFVDYSCAFNSAVKKLKAIANGEEVKDGKSKQGR